MRIGELAKQTGIKPSTIRFYEQKGLITPSSRSASGYRYYDESSLNHLIKIKFCQQLGFSLDDILDIINIKVGLDHGKVLVKLAERKNEIQGLITQLEKNIVNINTLENRLDNLWRNDECMSQEEIQQLLATTRL